MLHSALCVPVGEGEDPAAVDDRFVDEGTLRRGDEPPMLLVGFESRGGS